MRNHRWPIACLAVAWSSASCALCSADITTADVDAVALALQPQISALGAESTLQAMTREGVVEQIGELQVVKLLVGLRDGVTGRDNQLKVRDALRAVMHSVADNARALRELALQEGKGAIAPDARAALVGVLDREVALVRCEEPEKREAPATGGR